jgi:hypothetical protein
MLLAVPIRARLHSAVTANYTTLTLYNVRICYFIFALSTGDTRSMVHKTAIVTAAVGRALPTLLHITLPLLSLLQLLVLVMRASSVLQQLPSALQLLLLVLCAAAASTTTLSAAVGTMALSAILLVVLIAVVTVDVCHRMHEQGQSHGLIRGYRYVQVLEVTCSTVFVKLCTNSKACIAYRSSATQSHCSAFVVHYMHMEPSYLIAFCHNISLMWCSYQLNANVLLLFLSCIATRPQGASSSSGSYSGSKLQHITEGQQQQQQQQQQHVATVPRTMSCSDGLHRRASITGRLVRTHILYYV